ncbi:MAG TPA: hypothetical protein VHK04_06010 [Castellaniella sp.]|nr:hypothetical protein [Castellaniella sp.]
MGLAINSRAPAEIAVSILAELIAQRNAAQPSSEAGACVFAPGVAAARARESGTGN